jgi:SAM-dependent methyltransferase
MANEAQAVLWTDEVGPIWLAHEERVTSIAAPHGRAAMDAAAVVAGERVLDIGCGTGPTTIELAERVGADGRVVGVDLSPLLLDRARERADASGLDNIEFRAADVQTADLGSDFDVAYSRFGVMFFDDPVAAFANIRSALRSGGRLAFSCFQPIFANQWMAAPTMGAASVFPFTPPAPDAPGPFAFADQDRVRSILTDAGFTDIDIQPHDHDVEVGMDDSDIDQVLSMGPMRDHYTKADDETKRRAFAAVRESVASFADGGRYRFPSASWTVTARA